jgi:hypothetical protein
MVTTPVRGDRLLCANAARRIPEHDRSMRRASLRDG